MMTPPAPASTTHIPVQAKLLQRVTNLSLEDRFIFCMAPLPRGDARCEACLLEFAHSYAKGHPVAFNGDALPKGPPKDELEMAALESWHRVRHVCFACVFIRGWFICLAWV